MPEFSDLFVYSLLDKAIFYLIIPAVIWYVIRWRPFVGGIVTLAIVAFLRDQQTPVYYFVIVVWLMILYWLYQQFLNRRQWKDNPLSFLGVVILTGLTISVLSMVDSVVGGIRMPTDFVDVSAGDDHTCAVRQNGEVYCWGKNFQPQKRSSDPIYLDWGPATKHPLVTNAVDVEVSDNLTCAVLESGGVDCWGKSYLLPEGFAVDGAVNYVNVIGLNDKATNLSIKDGVVCVVLESDATKCVGSEGTREEFLRELENEPVERSKRVASEGRASSCAIVDGGRVQCWGSNRYGQLGINWILWEQSETPVNVRTIGLFADYGP